MDYLTRYRMERAKELLGDIDKKIYEVSSREATTTSPISAPSSRTSTACRPLSTGEKVIRMHD